MPTPLMGVTSSKDGKLYLHLNSISQNYLVITPEGDERKFTSSIFSPPQECPIESFTDEQCLLLALKYQVPAFSPFHADSVSSLCAFLGMIVSGGEKRKKVAKKLCELNKQDSALWERRSEWVAPWLLKPGDSFVEIDFMFPDTGKEYGKSFVRFGVHADSYCSAIDEFISKATEKNVSLIKGPKKAQKLGIDDLALANLQIVATR